MDRLINKILRLFRKKKMGAIHTWYPDILHWKQGDVINCWNIALASNNEIDMGMIQKFRDKSLGVMIGDFTYQSVDKSGRIYLEDEYGNLWHFEFWRFIKYAKNKSLENRNIKGKLRESDEYMELMEEFQKAFNDLQKADNHPHRLGEQPESRPIQSKKQNRRNKQKN